MKHGPFVPHWFPATLLSLVLVLAVFVPVRAGAPPTIQIRYNEAEIDYPYAVTFFLAASDTNKIESVVLYYGTHERTCVSSQSKQVMEVEAARRVDVEWTWDLTRIVGLPPGAQVWWQWEITTSTGETLLTERSTLTIEDPDYSWRHVSQGLVTVYWTEGGSDFGSKLVGLAQQSLYRLENQAGIKLETPIRIMIYPDNAAFQQAFMNMPIWSGGIAFPEYGTIATSVAPDQMDWARDVIPHEIGHLVTGERIYNCRGIELPTWLEEGLAVYSEGPLPEDYTDLLQQALEDEDLPALSSLSHGFSSQSEAANLSYAHSGAVVHYLIEQYGPEQMTTLLEAVRTGQNVSPALQDIYGLQADELDSAWRESLGFAGLTSQPAREPTRTMAPIPTLAVQTPIGRITATASPTAVSPTATHTAVPPTATSTPVPPPSPTAGLTPWLLVGLAPLIGLAGAVWLWKARRHTSFQQPE